MSFLAIILHQQKTHALRRFHPWVFSGAIKKKPALNEGDIAEVYADNGEYLGTGHYGEGSIAVRIFSFEKVLPDDLPALWQKKFNAAYQVRVPADLAESKSTNAYRLINAEGDGMPGLIIDWYNGTAVIQAHSKGMHGQKENFVHALQKLYGDRLLAVYDKSTSALHVKRETASGGEAPITDAYLLGSSGNESIQENNHSFKVSWEQGQKTGFFIDQRDNRALLAKYAAGKKVLNTFCYSGGFSVYAAKAGAATVHSVDSSARAIEWTNENMQLNGLASPQYEAITSDIFDFLKTAANDYEVVILDPPAFAKGQSARHSAIKAYTRLNRAAMDKIKPGGILFTFSCSQAVDTEMFAGAVTSAAIESRRNIRILHHLTQPADHPVSIYHPEGLYLKGLVLYIE